MSFDNQNQQTQPNGGAVNTPPTGIGAPAPLTPSENLAEFQALRKQFDDELKPRGIVEQTMVFQLACTAWRLRRLPFLESVLVGVLFQRGSAWKELDLLSRHESRLARTFKELLRDIEARHTAPPPSPERTSAVKPATPQQETKSASASGFSYQPVGTLSPSEASTVSAVPFFISEPLDPDDPRQTNGNHR